LGIGTAQIPTATRANFITRLAMPSVLGYVWSMSEDVCNEALHATSPAARDVPCQPLVRDRALREPGPAYAAQPADGPISGQSHRSAQACSCRPAASQPAPPRPAHARASRAGPAHFRQSQTGRQRRHHSRREASARWCPALRHGGRDPRSLHVPWRGHGGPRRLCASLVCPAPRCGPDELLCGLAGSSWRHRLCASSLRSSLQLHVVCCRCCCTWRRSGFPPSIRGRCFRLASSLCLRGRWG